MYFPLTSLDEIFLIKVIIGQKRFVGTTKMLMYNLGLSIKKTKNKNKKTKTKTKTHTHSPTHPHTNMKSPWYENASSLNAKEWKVHSFSEWKMFHSKQENFTLTRVNFTLTRLKSYPFHSFKSENLTRSRVNLSLFLESDHSNHSFSSEQV